MPFGELTQDCAKLADRPDSKTVMGHLKDWFNDYNSYRPHIALGNLPPTLFSEIRSITKTYRWYWNAGSRPSKQYEVLNL
jgi:hypothetical protein